MKTQSSHVFCAARSAEPELSPATSMHAAAKDAAISNKRKTLTFGVARSAA